MVSMSNGGLVIFLSFPLPRMLNIGVAESGVNRMAQWQRSVLDYPARPDTMSTQCQCIYPSLTCIASLDFATVNFGPC